MQHSMVTRYKAKQGTEDNKGEEMEMMEEIIEETIEEDTQGDQPENPTQPEPEVEGIVGDQPSKPIQKENLNLQDIMNFIAETSKKQEEKINEKLDQNNEKIDKMKGEVREDIETLNLSLIHIYC